MRFNRHSDLVGRHAFLSPSKYHWVNYTDEKLENVFRSSMAAQRGTELHAFAAEAIRLGVKLPRTNQTLNSFVNDAIGFRMTPEQPLCYSENAFGCADAISFRKNLLRIHDLKTGKTHCSEMQLEVYAALFCLEYRIKPAEINYDLRIYQNDEVLEFETHFDKVAHIMDRIVSFDNHIRRIREELDV